MDIAFERERYEHCPHPANHVIFAAEARSIYSPAPADESIAEYVDEGPLAKKSRIAVFATSGRSRKHRCSVSGIFSNRSLDNASATWALRCGGITMSSPNPTTGFWLGDRSVGVMPIALRCDGKLCVPSRGRPPRPH